MFCAVRQDRVPPWWPPLAAADPVYSDPRWLELFAGSRGETGTWWFGAGRGAEPEIGLRGTLVGAGTRKSMNPYRWLFERTGYHDREPLDAAAAPRPEAWFPALLCSYPGLDTYPVGAGDDPELVRELLAGLAGWAARRGLATVVVGFVQPERHPLATGAAAAGYAALPVATRSNLPLAGRTAAEVFGSFSGQQRNNLRRLRKRLAARGIGVEVVPDPLADLDTLVELRCAHARQHGKEPDPAEERSWLGPLLAGLGERVTVFGATNGDLDGDPGGPGGLGGGSRLRAFSLFVDDGRWWTAFAVARRDPADDRDVYFELMYHTPIEHAAAAGVAEIAFGYGTEEAKRRRGCVQVTVPALVYGVAPEVRAWAHATAAGR